MSLSLFSYLLFRHLLFLLLFLLGRLPFCVLSNINSFFCFTGVLKKNVENVGKKLSDKNDYK